MTQNADYGGIPWADIKASRPNTPERQAAYDEAKAAPPPNADYVRVIRHTSINPSFPSLSSGQALSVCQEWEKDGWQLERIIPHTAYETVLVFSRSVAYNGSSGTAR